MTAATHPPVHATCFQTCSGHGTQKCCPPLIVIASYAQQIGAKAGRLPCMVADLLRGKKK